MTTKQKNILILSIAGVILIVLLLFVLLSSRIPMNDEYTTGNTTGNLNNGGYFCEMDGRVYFANAYDNFALYSMNPDETDLVKFNEGAVSSINAAGNYLTPRSAAAQRQAASAAPCGWPVSIGAT